jgi:hypothetical protein
MTASNFTRLVSILFGVFALYAAARGFPVSLRHASESAADSVRFCLVLITAILGVMFLHAERVLAVTRRIARRTSPGPIRFSFGVIMVIAASSARLSNAISPWIAASIAMAFTVAFIVPGVAFRGLVVKPSREMSLREIGELVGLALRKSRRYSAPFIISSTMLISSVLSWAYSPQSIPSPTWATLAAWLAIFAALLTVFVICLPFWLVTPKEARDRTFPAIALFTIFSFLIATGGYRSLLIDLLPIGIAQYAGEEVANTFKIIKVVPNKYQRFCHSSLYIRTSAGVRELCNLPPDLLSVLSPGEVLVISGKMTLLGQTVEKVGVAD